MSRPTYPADNLSEQDRFFHHLEWGTANGYEYARTTVQEGETPSRQGWELNVDRWPTYDEEAEGWVRVEAGVLRSPRGELVAYWRRKRR